MAACIFFNIFLWTEHYFGLGWGTMFEITCFILNDRVRNDKVRTYRYPYVPYAKYQNRYLSLKQAKIDKKRSFPSLFAVFLSANSQNRE
jgi:hypothetical protein